MNRESAGHLIHEIREQHRESFVRDQWLITAIFKRLHNKDVQPIVSEGFIYKSQERYNAAWLAREIIQNFIDANPHDKQTLNGVHFEVEDIPPGEDFPKGGKRFKITGDWKFNKPTGLLSPHSEKADDRETAGGNGIGLKQAALRLFRDFGIQKFEIAGEEWNVAYGLTDKEQLNSELEAAAHAHDAEPIGSVDHNWLTGEVSRTAHSVTNTYTIETDNPEIITVLEQASRLGVSKENPYLQDLDLENEHGAIKWLPPSEQTEGQTQARGALFLNGQIMNVQTEGTTSTDYWRGPELMTLRLNNVKYNMSIDRPPVDVRHLEKYASEFIDSLTTEELITQLKKSEAIWTQIKDTPRYNSDRPACFAVINKIVIRLYCQYDIPADKIFAEHFTGKPYLALDRNIEESDQKKLREKGYILCPEYFSRIGMPFASSKMDDHDKLASEKPDEASFDRKRFAMTKGMDVYGESIREESKDTKNFIDYFIERLKDFKPQFEFIENRPQSVRFTFDVEMPERFLFHPLPRPQPGNIEQELLYFIRGAIAEGLKQHIFLEAHTAQEGFFSNYKLRIDDITEDDILMVRHVAQKATNQFTFEATLSPDAFAYIQSGVIPEKKDEEKPIPNIPVAETPLVEPEPDENEPPTLEDNLQNDSTNPQPETVSPTESPVVPEKITADETPVSSEPRKILEKKSKPSPVHTSISETTEVAPPITKKSRLRSWAPIAALVALSSGLWQTFERSTDEKPVPRTELPKAPPTKPPTFDEMTREMEKIVTKESSKLPPQKDATKIYDEWKKSSDSKDDATKNKVKVEGAVSLETLFNKKNLDEPNVGEANYNTKKSLEMEQKLEALKSKVQGEDLSDNFEIIKNPSKDDLKQLSLLQTYFEISTQTKASSKLFLYKEKGVLGRHFGADIALHIEMLKVPFFKALAVVVHENAHNLAQFHNNDFINVEETLFLVISQRLDGIAEKAVTGKPLAEEEKILLGLENQWEELRQKHKPKK